MSDKWKSLVGIMFWLVLIKAGLALEQNDEISLESLLDVQVSTASKYQQAARNTAASVTILSAEDLERLSFTTLSEALYSIGGFYLNYDRSYTAVGIRGFSKPSQYNNRFLLLLNGHRLNENYYGGAYVGPELALSLNSIERVEIIRGPGSALYGSNAMLGVINIITKKGEQLDGLEGKFNIGSGRHVENSLSFGKRVNQDFQFNLSTIFGDRKGDDLYFSEYDAPETNLGIARDRDWERYYGLTLGAQYKKLKLDVFATYREKGIPTGAWEATFNDNSTMLDERQAIFAEYNADFGLAHHTKFSGFIDHYYYKGVYPYEELDNYDANDVFWGGLEFVHVWDVLINNRLLAGFEYQNSKTANYKLWDEETTLYYHNNPYSMISCFLQDEHEITNKLIFSGGARIDKFSWYDASFSPRLAMVYHPNRSHTIKLLYSNAFRKPDLYEAFYADPTSAKSNPALKPEKLDAYEALWNYSVSKNLGGSVSLYYNDFEELINDTVDPIDSLTQFVNSQHGAIGGIEFGLAAQVKNGLKVNVNYSIQHTHYNGENRWNYNSPGHLFKGILSYQFPQWLNIAIESYYETGRLTVYDTHTKPFLLTNLTITTRGITKHLNPSLRITNLFDAEYEYPGGYELVQNAIRQDGRRFIFGLRYNF